MRNVDVNKKLQPMQGSYFLHNRGTKWKEREVSSFVAQAWRESSIFFKISTLKEMFEALHEIHTKLIAWFMQGLLKSDRSSRRSVGV